MFAWSGCYTGVHIHPNLKFLCFRVNILFTAEGKEDCPDSGAESSKQGGTCLWE